MILDNFTFEANIGVQASAIFFNNTADKIATNDQSLDQIIITNWEFNSNGSTHGTSVMNIEFLAESDVYNLTLENNIFKRNFSKLDGAVVRIVNSGETNSDRSLTMFNNTFE